ncbi:MAG: hydrogenase maturation nickel metallochaperone HypA [Streptosporangiaceae bacterium]
MHEYGMCASVLDAVERRAAGRRVDGVRVRVGVLHRVVDDAFEQAFSMVAEGTVAEGAGVEIVASPVHVECRACGRSTDIDDVPVACADCGATDLAVGGGDELILESLRLVPAQAGQGNGRS